MKIYKLINILLFLILEIKFIHNLKQAPVIKTPYGLIKGVNDKNVFMYLGIPYASPPVNDLRWKNPIDVKPWQPNILNASQFKPACPQLNCSSRMPNETCPSQV